MNGMKRMKKPLCFLVTLLLLWTCVPSVWAAAYTVSSAKLSVGENPITAESAKVTLYAFVPPEVGAYTVTVEDGLAVLSYWHGSPYYVAGLAEEATDGELSVTCSAVGQSFLIGLTGVDAAVITITAQEGYVPPVAVVYEPYVNVHTPVADFAMPDAECTRVDITQPQTVVADADGVYHLGAADGPVLYVNMRAAVYADLYTCYHPNGGAGALYMRGTYLDGEGHKQGYEFLEAMRPYAEALDADGYYYLTVDLAAYIQMYGQNQGWFQTDASPFTAIKQGKFTEESAWLVNAYYVAPATYAGDMDGNGKVNNRDLGLLQQYLNEWKARINPLVGDMDGDGKVNNRDLGLLQRVLNE